MTLVYATSADYANWTGTTAPATAAQLLRSASLLVRDATMTAVYTVDATGTPTDTAVVEAFRDATCAQVAAWTAGGVDPATAGLPTTSTVRAKGIGSARVEYDTGQSQTVAALDARQQLARELCDESRRILSQAGLLNGGVWSYG